MKTLPLLLAWPLHFSVILAGPVDEANPLETPGGPDAFQWITPSIDARTRYEFRKVDGSDPSHALTARAQVG